MATGKEGSMISRIDAQHLLNNYRNSPAFPINRSVEGILFGRDHIFQLLNQPGCMGLRMYYGTDLNGDPHLVIVGTDLNGDDMAAPPFEILDTGVPCPTFCSSPATKI
ncbi:MAG: hypothetical protein P1U56_13560 [Saprospiraceae bacterium]|nr:hypothetical protein [Saprospiraceae bacterium]